jgi:DNA-binding NarL/FixJ family response regulator
MVGDRSSVMVGRDDELRAVQDALDAARAGHGSTVFVVGESGVGKSRLIAAAAELGHGMRLLRGRGSAIGPTVPFRPLTEALLSLPRAGVPVDVAALGPYRAVLARLVPDWADAPARPDDGSPVILAEAVLRLTELVGREHGCLVTLDDLQDADADTLAVLEYLIDNVGQQRTLVLGAVRDDDRGSALRLVRSAGQRDAAVLLELERLNRAESRRLAGVCLGVEARDVPAPAVDLLWAGSAGNPLRVKELLNGMVDGGFLEPAGGGWTMPDRLPAGLPTTFTRSVARRLERLDAGAREALSVAAVLGHRFPLAVVRAVTGMAYRDLLGQLHGDIVMADETPDWYAFQHSLIAEALLNLLDPAERAGLARRAADAVEAIYPGLPGEWCQICAALRLDAGQRAAAGRLLVEAGQRALAEGAAHSAVTVLDRAWQLLADDVPARVTALEHRVYALAEAGLVDRALAEADLLDDVGTGLDPRRRARIHTRLAWVANVDGRTAEGLRQLDAARALLGPTASTEDTVPLDVIAAYLALDLPGPDHLRTAEDMARRAAIAAEELPLPVVACQAWQLLGALARARDPDEATAYLERSRVIAVRHDLPIWETHALVRLGMDEALRTGALERIEQARRQASRIGAVTARYQAEVNLALQLVLRGEFGAAETLIDQVLTATTRLKLVEVTQLTLVLRAVLAGHRGRRAELDGAVAELRRWRGDGDQYAPRIHGLAKTFCALLEENRPLARSELSHALRAEEANPTTFHLAGRYGLDLVLRALAGEVGWADYEATTSVPASGLRWDRQFALFARAVLAGRSGHIADAAAAVDEAIRVGAPYAMGRHLGLRLVAEAALADGWGTPGDWLRAAEDYFHGVDVPAVAKACRTLLRRTGPHAVRRPAVPPPLRSAGVTSREYEVLQLLGKRLRNREIAERLHLSQRTVETHVSSLLTKTGSANRIELSRFTAD